jgi:hypothetical protein
MKAINPQNRWSVAQAAAQTPKALREKAKQWELYNYNESRGDSELYRTRHSVFTKCFEEHGQTMHSFSPVCFFKEYKATSWRRELWVCGCHWASHIYLLMARAAYPDIHWVRVEGNLHSSVFGFKAKPPSDVRRRILVGLIDPDMSYDLIAFALNNDPLAWVRGIEKAP